jgi:hypothetical protein
MMRFENASVEHILGMEPNCHLLRRMHVLRSCVMAATHSHGFHSASCPTNTRNRYASGMRKSEPVAILICSFISPHFIISSRILPVMAAMAMEAQQASTAPVHVRSNEKESSDDGRLEIEAISMSALSSLFGEQQRCALVCELKRVELFKETCRHFRTLAQLP